MTRSARIVCSAFLLVAGFAVTAAAEPIEDNSFLVEEAYNQEPGIWQFIQVWQKPIRGHSWTYTFINEIPAPNQTHQLSYEIPLIRSHSESPELGDLKLNYRQEFWRFDAAVGTGRVSLLLPIGDEKKGLGNGAFGGEVSLISSVTLGRHWVQHWNIGYGITPDAKGSGARADVSHYFLNFSQIYLFTDQFNFMVEATLKQQQFITSAVGETKWQGEAYLSPSVRYGLNRGGFQFVPGLAFPIGVGPTAGDNQVLVYLSIEEL